MAVKVKPVKAVKKSKRGRPKGSKNKPKESRITATQIYELIAETLQANSEGEFDVPSVMVKYNDKSDPRSKLGLHREYYVPAGKELKFYPNTSTQAMTIYHNQASMILPALVGEGVLVKEKDVRPPFCKKHK